MTTWNIERLEGEEAFLALDEEERPNSDPSTTSGVGGTDGIFSSEKGGGGIDNEASYRIPRAWLPEGMRAGDRMCARPQSRSFDTAKVKLWKKKDQK